MEKYLIIAGVCLVVFLLVAMLWPGRSRKSQRRKLGFTPTRPSGIQEHWLLGQDDSIKGKAWHIGERTITLGRGVGNYVQVTDEAVSRIHCQLVAEKGRLMLTDKANRKNTLVNENVITQHRLIDGDMIRIGETVLLYRSHGNFGDNAGMERKEVGNRVIKATQMGSMQTVHDVLRTALLQYNGDTEQAAASLGMRHELYLNSLKVQRIDPADYQS